MKSDNTQQQRARIILSAGSKGGVGKSMVSIATIDTLLAAGVGHVEPRCVQDVRQHPAPPPDEP
jgi:hypothetical protein